MKISSLNFVQAWETPKGSQRVSYSTNIYQHIYPQRAHQQPWRSLVRLSWRDDRNYNNMGFIVFVKIEILEKYTSSISCFFFSGGGSTSFTHFEWAILVLKYKRCIKEAHQTSRCSTVVILMQVYTGGRGESNRKKSISRAKRQLSAIQKTDSLTNIFWKWKNLKCSAPKIECKMRKKQWNVFCFCPQNHILPIFL